MKKNSYMQENLVNALNFEGVNGDGLQDDTTGLQAALDTRAGLIYFPKPKDKYLVSNTLVIYSGQTLIVDRDAVVKLADHACAHMLTNSDHINGNKGITVTGGIWDGNNLSQTCEYHENGGEHRIPYDESRYLGVLMRFNNVLDLNIGDLTLKDPECFGMQLGNLQHFKIEDITFDYNLLKLNMDGVHIHGNCHNGVVKNLKGATNDDLLALNADDGWMYEMSRGPITNITVDGIFAEGGYTAVRLLSSGSKISKVHISDIFGSYRYYGVSFTHHDVHPGEMSVFEEIVIENMFCSKSVDIENREKSEYGVDPTSFPLIWIAPGTIVKTLHLNHILRNESPSRTSSTTITVEEGAEVEYMAVCNATLINRTENAIDLLTNHGRIAALNLVNIYGKAEGGVPRGFIVSGHGVVENKNLANVIINNFVGIEETGGIRHEL